MYGEADTDGNREVSFAEFETLVCSFINARRCDLHAKHACPHCPRTSLSVIVRACSCDLRVVVLLDQLEELKTGALRPLDPEFTSGPAPLAFLGLATADDDATTEAGVGRAQPGGWLALAPAMLIMLGMTLGQMSTGQS
eukprot:2156472-Rhodomonas_salina.8